MKTRNALDTIGSKATGIAGSVAGTVADPPGGLSKLKSSVTKPSFLMVAAAVVAAWLLGRRAARYGH